MVLTNSVFFFLVANFCARGKFRKSARAREKSARGKKDLNFARETCKLPVAKKTKILPVQL